MLTRRLFAIALIASLLLPLSFARAKDDDSAWTRLGKVDFDTDTKEKDVTANIQRGGWKSLKLKVANADAKVDAVTVVFTSGKEMKLEFKDEIKAGDETRPISLRGADDRPIKKVHIKAHSTQSGAKAIIEVWLKDTD